MSPVSRSLRIALTAAAVLVASAVTLAGCGGGGGDPSGTPDAPRTPDSSGIPVTLPTWKLEDIQPQSPRVGQTYGLDTFAGKIVVVTLVEGF
jgi:hypothetical protein